MPNSALPGYKAAVNIAVGPSVGSTDLILTDAGDHATFTVPLASSMRYIDRNVAVTVETSLDNGVTWSSVLDPSTYTLRYLTAQVVLTTPLVGGTTYKARLHAFNYYAYALIAQATDITFAPTRAMLDSTTFQGASGAGWTTYVPGLSSGGKFTCKTWQLTPGATIFVGYLTASSLLILSFVAPNGTNAFESYCYLDMTTWTSNLTTLASEDLSFTCDAVVALL